MGERTVRTMGYGWQLGLGAALIALSGCGEGKDYSADSPVKGPRPGPERQFDPNAPSLFGPDGFTISSLADGSLAGGSGAGTGGIPVNRYLWQASLETLSFLPLASTDPFTGVIATDWGSTPEAPGERYKVTAFMTSPALAASSVNVAVYREVRNEDGAWLPAAVDPATATQIEDAILTRARQIRIADAGATTG